MSMPVATAHPSPFRRFLRTWRRELIRGGVLFGLVVGVGLVINQVRISVAGPLQALRAVGDMDFGDLAGGGDLFGAHREVGDPWEYRTALKPGQRLWIRNMNGPIEVVSGADNWVEVIAEKSWRRASPRSVELVAVPSERGVTICALWDARERRCEDGGEYRHHGVRKSDVAVRFTIKLPRGVPLDASTVNGALEIDGVSAPVDASTVNGRIQVRTAMGPVNASTVNGSIEAFMEALRGGDVELGTVNGSVTVALPTTLSARLDAQTVNGRVETEFPVQLTGRISPRQLRGTIGGAPAAGAGAELRTLKLNTVNGSITIRRAESPPSAAPRPPRPPRPARVERTAPAAVTPAPPAPPPQQSQP